jgi:hypothetical protein
VAQLMCKGPGFSLVHSSLARSFVGISTPRAVTAEVASQRLQDLVEGVAVCQAATSKSNRAQRSAAYGQWTKYLNDMGEEPTTATPSHALAYLVRYSKRGTYMTPKGPRCAPGSLKNHIGYLRKGAAVYDGLVGPSDAPNDSGGFP